jgi:PAS domain S-box-containing protein
MKGTPIPCDQDAGFCHTFIQSVQDHAILFFSPDARLIGMNPAAVRIFQYTPEEVLNKRADFIFTPEDRAQGVPGKEMTTARDQGSADDDRWHIRKDGSRFWANGAMCALRDTEGNLLGFAKIIRDRTAHREALDSLQDSQKRLSQSNLELERFASIISHDLQAPLYKISRLVEDLREQVGRSIGLEGMNSLADLQETSERMAGMIKGVLGYARIGKMELETSRFPLAQILSNVSRDLAGLLEKKEARLRYHALPEVEADEVLLYQLFLNLISNALKHGQRRPLAVEVSAQLQANEWHIQVRDNGVGIAEKDQSRIFGFSQRGDGSETGGLGIGLSVCKRVVERHGGRIWIESKPGEGAAFHFTLPQKKIT